MRATCQSEHRELGGGQRESPARRGFAAAFGAGSVSREGPREGEAEREATVAGGRVGVALRFPWAQREIAGPCQLPMQRMTRLKFPSGLTQRSGGEGVHFSYLPRGCEFMPRDGICYRGDFDDGSSFFIPYKTHAHLFDPVLCSICHWNNSAVFLVYIYIRVCPYGDFIWMDWFDLTLLFLLSTNTTPF